MWFKFNIFELVTNGNQTLWIQDSWRAGAELDQVRSWQDDKLLTIRQPVQLIELWGESRKKVVWCQVKALLRMRLETQSRLSVVLQNIDKDPTPIDPTHPSFTVTMSSTDKDPTATDPTHPSFSVTMSLLVVVLAAAVGEKVTERGRERGREAAAAHGEGTHRAAA